MEFKSIEQGGVYNRWTVTSDPFKKGKIYYVNATCKCGTIREVKKNNILSGRSESCGCLTRENLIKLSTGKIAHNAKSVEDLSKREHQFIEISS